jgi:hypothetical protein
MRFLLTFVRGLGASGAAANARAELALAHDAHLQAALVARRVDRYASSGPPPVPATVARVA